MATLTSGSTSAPLPPAAGGVCEDDDEDRNDVGTRGTGHAKTTDQDIVITRGTIGYARTTLQIDTTIKKLVKGIW